MVCRLRLTRPGFVTTYAGLARLTSQPMGLRVAPRFSPLFYAHRMSRLHSGFFSSRIVETSLESLAFARGDGKAFFSIPMHRPFPPEDFNHLYFLSPSPRSDGREGGPFLLRFSSPGFNQPPEPRFDPRSVEYLDALSFMSPTFAFLRGPCYLVRSP